MPPLGLVQWGDDLSYKARNHGSTGNKPRGGLSVPSSIVLAGGHGSAGVNPAVANVQNVCKGVLLQTVFGSAL